jgi:hypothetical protein
MGVTVNRSKEKTYILYCIKHTHLTYARCFFAVWVQRCNLAKSNEGTEGRNRLLVLGTSIYEGVK